MDQVECGCRVVSFIHSSSVSMISAYLALFESQILWDPFTTTHPASWFMIATSAGYFASDAIALVYARDSDWEATFIHHILVVLTCAVLLVCSVLS